MKHEIRNTDQWGRVLFLEEYNTQIGIALDFGIRIVHLSVAGMENLYYVQPKDLSDGFVTPDGWKLYGGHRLWSAPESDLSYCPDNDPVSYEILENGAAVTQGKEKWLGISKRLAVTFEDGKICLTQTIKNEGDAPITCASWGVNTLGPGTAEISFPGTAPGDYTPRRRMNLWANTNPHDPRLSFEKDRLTATFQPLADYCKLGLYTPEGNAVYTAKGQKFTLTFHTPNVESCPDGGCNFELYMGAKFMELETMSTVKTLNPGEETSHQEFWTLETLS